MAEQKSAFLLANNIHTIKTLGADLEIFGKTGENIIDRFILDSRRAWWNDDDKPMKFFL